MYYDKLIAVKIGNVNLQFSFPNSNLFVRFGGDPNNVTIFGQSAGACSVGLHMMSPMSAGLYDKVILQSGTAASTFASMDNKTAIESAK